MRLFTAILLEPAVRRGVFETVERLRGESQAGRFTPEENLHLTLVFLGETGRTQEIIQAMAGVGCCAFDLCLQGFGSFSGGKNCRAPGERLYWMGAKATQPLLALERGLRSAFREMGLPVEEREFRPHLTLGRQVRLPADFDARAFGASLPVLTQRVRAVSLMRSDRVDGGMRYTEIFRKELKES